MNKERIKTAIYYLEIGYNNLENNLPIKAYRRIEQVLEILKELEQRNDTN